MDRMLGSWNQVISETSPLQFASKSQTWDTSFATMMFSASQLQKICGVVFHPLHLCPIISDFILCISLDTCRQPGIGLRIQGQARRPISHGSIEDRRDIFQDWCNQTCLERTVQSHEHDLPPSCTGSLDCLSNLCTLFPAGTDGHQQIEWTVVLQVCTHWRRIALESPSVWGYVTFA